MVLVLGALGIVYGDIGTNVLFALRAAFVGPYGASAARSSVLGVLSLIVWALLLVLCFKYLGFIMRADNHGEGGILALLSRLALRSSPVSRRRKLLTSIGLIGAALLYGDGMVTPAISVLAAVEGLAVADPALQRAVVPVTLVILIILFATQHRGTGRLSAVFGPVMLAWFVAIAALGVRGIVQQPDVLHAANPLHAARFLLGNGLTSFLVLGAVVLTVAGAEALYADMGQFGAGAIRTGWYGFVFPALLLNYLGQGAMLLQDSGVAGSPFYALVPAPIHFAIVGLATAATIVASQAMISGAFSLTRQAIQLGYLPRVTIRHTSSAISGRVYIPEVNFALMAACIALVLAFATSSRLAAAYGMAVAGAMMMTTILFFFFVRERWHWSVLRAGSVVLMFLLLDIAFVGASLVKLPHGAWIPLAVAAAVYTLMSTWRSGVRRLTANLVPVPIDAFLADVQSRKLTRVPGVAVILTARPETMPYEISHYVKRTRTLHEQLVLLTVSGVEVPRIDDAERVEVRRIPGDVLQVTMRYGFMESPDVPEALARTDELVRAFARNGVTYLLGQVTPLSTDSPGMVHWRKALFGLLWRLSRPPWFHLRLPAGEVVEVGMEVEL